MRPLSTAVLGAVAASVAAALVHAAAAGTHTGAPELVRLFAVFAAVQAIVAGAAVLRPSRASLLAVAGVNAAAVAAWAFSRTTGLPWPDLLRDAAEVGTQDLAAAVLGAAATVFAAVALARSGSVRPTPARSTLAAGALCAAMVVIAVPGMAAEHDHDEASHDHAHDEATHPTDSTDPTGPVVSLDDVRLTAAERDAAEDLIDTTTDAMAAFPDQAAIEAAGYTSIGDGGTGFEHFVNLGYLTDDRELDPGAIESIVMKLQPDGTKVPASAMYILTPGKTMTDVPDIAGELTTWHDHQNLCWEGLRVVGTTDATGSCQRGTFMGTPPMLHVWLPSETPACGPFAGIEGSHGSDCATRAHTH